jgi:hypothetical protein
VSSTVGEGTEVVVRLASGGGGEVGEPTGDLTAPESLAPISMDERPAGGG